MKLHQDWKKILTDAWSVRWMVISFLLQILEVLMPYLEEIPTIPRGVLALLSAVSLIGGVIARLIHQKGFGNADQ